MDETLTFCLQIYRFNYWPYYMLSSVSDVMKGTDEMTQYVFNAREVWHDYNWFGWRVSFEVLIRYLSWGLRTNHWHWNMRWTGTASQIIFYLNESYKITELLCRPTIGEYLDTKCVNDEYVSRYVNDVSLSIGISKLLPNPMQIRRTIKLSKGYIFTPNRNTCL